MAPVTRRARTGGKGRPLPVEGLVPYKGRVLCIRFRAQVSAGVYTCIPQDPDTGRNEAHNVRHAELPEVDQEREGAWHR